MLMCKKDLLDICSRLKGLLFDPQQEWQRIGKEDADRKRLFRHFIVFPCCLFSLLVVLIHLSSRSVVISVEYGVINFVSCLAGVYITWKVAREYLANKDARYQENSLKLTVYSFAVFLLFRSLSVGFTNSFWGDLMAVFSLIVLYTLYVGIDTLPELSASHKKSAFIIIGLLIACTPAIITRLLTILLRVPAINA